MESGQENLNDHEGYRYNLFSVAKSLTVISCTKSQRLPGNQMFEITRDCVVCTALLLAVSSPSREHTRVLSAAIS